MLPSDLPTIPHLDKLVHLLMYFPFGLTVALVLALTPRSKQWWVFAIFALSFPIMDELHQTLIPTRSCSGWDMMADYFGFFFGATAAIYRAGRKPLT
jgi:VanZ family protein